MSSFTGGLLKESLQRVPGVSKVDIMGEKRYAMRVWVDPEKMPRSSPSV